MGWTYRIAVVPDMLLDSWHSHCALRSIARVFKSATSNPGWVRFAPWPDLFICVLIISMETAIVLEDITPSDSASSQFTSVSARSLKGNLLIEHICLMAYYRSDMWPCGRASTVKFICYFSTTQGSFFNGKFQRLVTS